MIWLSLSSGGKIDSFLRTYLNSDNEQDDARENKSSKINQTMDSFTYLHAAYSKGKYDCCYDCKQLFVSYGLNEDSWWMNTNLPCSILFSYFLFSFLRFSFFPSLNFIFCRYWHRLLFCQQRKGNWRKKEQVVIYWHSNREGEGENEGESTMVEN